MAKPPVAKLMDFGKYKYEAAMKAREARKNQVNTVIKEIKLRPKIDPHDYGTKKGHVERFLKGGDKVKVTIMFRGREQSRPELGFRLLQKLAQDVAELGFRRVGAQAGRPQHGHGHRPDQEEGRGPCRAAPPS
jgi:translation initiation factor IF-3